MNKENFYKIVSTMDEITTKNLKENGISSYYISKFVNEKILVREEIGKYRLKNFNDFYAYGKKLLRDKELDNAIKVFNKCINIDSSFVSAYFQKIIASILKENYEDVLWEVDYLSNINIISNNERVYLLYLLSNIIDLPKIYLNELDFFSFEAIRYNNIEDKYAYNENVIRGLCYKKDFENALSKSNRKNKSVFNSLHYALLLKITNKFRNIDKNINDLIDEEKYKSAIDLLNENHCNTNKYIHIKALLDEIICVSEKGLLPKTSLINANSVYEAIEGKNYALALFLCTDNNLIKKLLSVLSAKIKEKVEPQIENRSKESLNYFTLINADNYYVVEKEIDYICKRILKNRGVYIFEAFNEKTTKDILNILSLYPDLKSSIINYNLEDRIVIRYCPEKQEEVDVKNSFVYADFYFNYKHYQECLEKCLDILQTEKPGVNAYLLAAWTYIKLKKTKDARNCFMIAYNITKRTKYKDILASMQGSEYKESFIMDINEFYGVNGNAKIMKK